MSDFMKNMAGRNGSSTNRGAPQRPIQTNMAIQITGFDLAAPNGGVVNGVVCSPDWAEGEAVSIRLQTEQECVATFRAKYSPADNRKFFDKGRATLAKLAEGYKVGANHIEPMKVGGYLMFTGAMKDHEANANSPEGTPTVWKAQYPKNYGNDSRHDVVHGAGRVSMYTNPETKHSGAYLDLLFPRKAVDVKDIATLRAFFDDHMEGQVEGADRSTQAVMRLVSKDDQVKTMWAYAVREEVLVAATVDGQEAKKYTIAGSAHKNWEAAVVNGTQAKGLIRVVAAALGQEGLALSPSEAAMARDIGNDLARGDLNVEIIPGRRIPIVGSSLEELMDSDAALCREAEKCLVPINDGKGVIPGFVKMTVGMMTTPARAGTALPATTIITKFAVDAFAHARTIDFLPSANYTPVFTVARDAESQQRAEAAAKQGGIEETPQAGLGDDEPSAPSAQREAAMSGPAGM